MVRVLPDVAGLDKSFDYLVPPPWRDQVRVGTRVRVPLHGRRVGAWVIETAVSPPAGVTLKPVARITGLGPSAGLIDLAGWAAWRWAGRRSSLLRTASPPTAVTALTAGPASPAAAAPRAVPAAPTGSSTGTVDALAARALSGPGAVVRLAPGGDRFPLVAAAVRRGDALVLTPSIDAAGRLAARLRRSGATVAMAPGEWARAAGGATVVGARAAVWAPVPELAAVVVLDEHDEAYKEERAPCWHAREVAVERARRAGVPCVLVSPCPSLEALAWVPPGTVLAQPPSEERAGWPVLDVVDRRREDQVRAGLYSSRLVELLRDPQRGRALCVLNRSGRSMLLACARCGELARCEACASSLAQPVPGVLACRHCGRQRPVVCRDCGSTVMKNLRVGVSRVREELEALVGEPVGELTGRTAAHDPARQCRVLVGTEAVLHGGPGAAVGVVAFLDFDQELLAPRYRSGEEAMALLARAARVLGGRRRDGRLVVQTRLPGHAVVLGAQRGDPTRVSAEEQPRRAALGFPPAVAMAVVSGTAAPAFMEALGTAENAAIPEGVEVLGPSDGRWLVRAPDHRTLCDALAAAPRPPGRLRIEVDPLRA